MDLVKPSYVSLKNDPQYNERWLHELLIEDASWLDLGELFPVGSEKAQPSGGRLDLLLADTNSEIRYTVELQLGALDESHIVRAIEYWDIERRRYPQYEHIAVIVAEDITSRFLNVIGLLHHSIPLIAIQLQAVKVGDALTLIATRVHDYLPPGSQEEDAGSLVDQSWWVQRSSKEAMSLVDKLYEVAKGINPNVSRKFNKAYIGILAPSGRQAFIMRPGKRGPVSTEFKVPEDEQLTECIDSSTLRLTGEYNKQWGHYKISVRNRDLEDEESAKLVKDLMQRACGPDS